MRAHNSGDVLIGVPEREPSGDYYNSRDLAGHLAAQVYRKSHLVPFGEFFPLRPVLGWIMDVLAIPLQDFSRGPQTPQPLEVAGQRVAVNVCYEDAFGEEIIRQLPAATLLVNLSNVAWFGRLDRAAAAPSDFAGARARNRPLHAARNEYRDDRRGRRTRQARRSGAAVHDVMPLPAMVQGYTGATPYVAGATGRRHAAICLRASLATRCRSCTRLARSRSAESTVKFAVISAAALMLTFQQIILALNRFWDRQGCALLQPYDMEVGAGTFHTATFLRAIGPEPWNAAYVQPSRRPKDGRYGENPNRLQHYYQYQVVMKPSPRQSPGPLSESLSRWASIRR